MSSFDFAPFVTTDALTVPVSDLVRTDDRWQPFSVFWGVVGVPCTPTGEEITLEDAPGNFTKSLDKATTVTYNPETDEVTVVFYYLGADNLPDDVDDDPKYLPLLNRIGSSTTGGYVAAWDDTTEPVDFSERQKDYSSPEWGTATLTFERNGAPFYVTLYGHED